MDNEVIDTSLLVIPLDEVGYGFEMNPSTDDLLRGDELRDGMVVLLEDRLVRGHVFSGKPNSLEAARSREGARWARIEKLQKGELVSFIAVYGDGTKRGRRYNRSFFWFVKKDSMAAAEGAKR